ncbi:PEGA domain-containing protein [Oceaniserpentilla sp. 4NH20-0058]|uniref:PEGA domain-containing protein n=1 Tax=Oceaniserpentilla sp. 4NH20-0058 TaxID=3127660 RepID=UPI00333F82EF
MKILAILFLAIGLSGCASIISGTSQDITFDSNPQGAKVYLDGKIMGTTPFTFSAAKNKYSSLRVEKEGYVSINRTVGKSFDPVALINIFWDLSTTDALTGAVFKYDENNFFFDLQPRN